MISLAIFLAVTCAALVFGFLIFKSTRRLRLIHFIPLTIVVGTLVIFLSGFAYLVVGLSFPADDDARWSALDKIEIDLDSGKKDVQIDERVLPAKERRWSAVETAVLAPDIAYVISYPRDARTDNDVTVALAVSSPIGKLPYKEYRAGLRSGEKLKIWSRDRCPTELGGEEGDACLAYPGATRSAAFVWNATPSSEGRRQLSMRLPQLWDGEQWTAVFKINSNISVMCGRGRIDLDGGCYGPARLLSAGTGIYAAPNGDFSIDLNNQEVRFPIEFSTPLGLSSETYAWLAVFGMFLSGALGSGWLFKFIEWVWPPRKDSSKSGGAVPSHESAVEEEG